MATLGAWVWPSWADLALAVVATVVGVGQLVLEMDQPPVGQLVGAAVMGLALAWRRRIPVGVLVLATGAFAAQDLARFDTQYLYAPMILVIAYYTAGAYTEFRHAVVGFVVGLGLLAVGTFGAGLDVANFVYPALIVGMPWGFGAALRARIAVAVAAETRARLAEEEKERLAAAAVTEERTRIARELHDLVAHSVSVMVMHAGVLRRMLGPHERERGVIDTIERAGREALVEMRRMLELLRSTDDGVAPLAPQPGLARIEELIDRTRGAGVEVELVVEQEPRELPPGVDLCAYRIVQESLTNVIKHAGRATACVRITYGPGSVELEVVDDGRGGPTRETTTPGHGLIGMRERVSLFGGQLNAGPRPGGGFAVRALLPIGAQ